MKKLTAAAIAAVLIAAFASSAGAKERHRGRHVHHAAVSTGDPRDAYASGYYPGWGRPMVPSYGVYPGLIYGGATFAPAGR